MRSIQTSLSISLAIQTFIGLGLVCAAIYAMTDWSFRIRQDEEFERHAEVVRHVLAETNNQVERGTPHKLDDYFASHSNIKVSLWSNAKQLYTARRSAQAAESSAHWSERATILHRNNEPNATPLELRMAIDVGSDDILLARLGWTLIGTAVLGALLVSLSGAWLVRRGLAPLKRLAAQTAASGPGHPGHRIDPTDYASELQPWIGQFNALLGRVEGAYVQLEAFNANVAHELRTPLSNMVAQVEVELGQVRCAAELQDVLSSVLEDARRLSGIVSDMLFLSRADRGVQARRGQPVSLAEQVQAVAEFQEAALEEAQLSLCIEGDARMCIDTGLVRRAISNLVSNAIRYTTPNNEICVHILREGDEVRLSVDNPGPAITEADPSRLFERFYRGDPSRAGSSAHHGLGLAIVAAIARMHGGRTFAEYHEGITRIGLTLCEDATGDAAGA